jgi:hypothetical protein
MSKTVKMSVNVIGTFEKIDQHIFDAEVEIPSGKVNEADLDELEIALVSKVIEQLGESLENKSNLEELVKLSFCYNIENISNNQEAVSTIDHLCRNSAKYYFQPNQRDAIENAIAERSGIATKTRDFG